MFLSLALLLLFVFSTSEALSSPPLSSFKHCVVVGGGPIGLATALTLSKPPHSYSVTVLEKTPDGTVAYDPTRAYLYLVNPRGYQWFDLIGEDALPKMERVGTVSSARDSIIVPADPEEPIDLTTGGSALANLTLSKNKALRSLWVPRHQMIQLLLDTCKEHNRYAMTDKYAKQIEVFNNRQVVNVVEREDGNAIQVQCSDGTIFDASLLVAADGIDSTVRQCLASRGSNGDSSWLHSRARDFAIKAYRSPSSGLKLKCLQFPPNFTLTNTDGSMVQSKSTQIYTIRSVNKGESRVSLGLLPVKDPNLIRPANINLRYNHPVWKIQDGPTMKAYFEKAFPRIDWSSIITNDDEWQRFATATGTTYPKPQYSPASILSSPNNDNVGVVMVGDACHAFPPDIGQGINAGLNDVVALDRTLKGRDIYTGRPLFDDAKSKPSLHDALKAYQSNRKWEHRALIRLARFGAPYQYKQSWPRDRVGAALWFVNAALRQGLAKISGNRIPPIAIVQCFATLDDAPHFMTYRSIMRKSDTTTRIMKGGLLLGLAGWLLRRFVLKA